MLKLFVIFGGHEIIGKVSSEAADHTFFMLDHPLVVRPIQKAPGQYALDLFPHSLTNPEGTHKFYVAQIVSESTVVPVELEKAYLERTSSIILASALDQMERNVK